MAFWKRCVVAVDQAASPCMQCEGRGNGLAAAVHKQPHRHEKKNDGEDIAGHFAPLRAREKPLQATRQQHDQAVH